MKQPMGFCVVAVGNAFDGMRLIGPFNNEEEASEWGYRQVSRAFPTIFRDWYIVPIEAQEVSE